jgi:hypothetical protein
MKKNVVLGMMFVFVFSFFLITASQGEEKVATSGGRYQLFQGTYTVNNAVTGTATEYKTVFRIDTETGKTYYFDSRVWKSGQGVEYWVEIKEEDEALQEAIKSAQLKKELDKIDKEKKETQ